MPKALGIDFGEARIGLALSDEEKQFAFEYQVWPAADFFAKIKALVQAEDIDEIALGLPLNMQGADTKKTAEARNFQVQLAELLPDTKVELVDERLSSKMAEHAAQQAGNKRVGKKIDGLAAQIILATFLSRKRPAQ